MKARKSSKKQYSAAHLGENVKDFVEEAENVSAADFGDVVKAFAGKVAHFAVLIGEAGENGRHEVAQIVISFIAERNAHGREANQTALAAVGNDGKREIIHQTAHNRAHFDVLASSKMLAHEALHIKRRRLALLVQLVIKSADNLRHARNASAP